MPPQDLWGEKDDPRPLTFAERVAECGIGVVTFIIVVVIILIALAIWFFFGKGYDGDY